MASIGDVINDKVLPPILKFVNTKPITALKNGMMFVMPLTIVGAVFLLIANFPIESFVEWQKAVGINDVFMQVFTATFNLLGVVACIGITYSFVRAEGYDALPASVWAFCAMVMLLPLHITEEGVADPVGGVIPLDWSGAKSMLAGILVAFFVSYVYCWFLKKNITIKMPPGVPPNVATAFTSLIPGAVILSLTAVIFGIFKYFDTTMVEAIYTAVQTPLQGISDSLPGILVISFLTPFLWFFGVHGSSIVSGIMQPIALANAAENQAILDKGMDLTVANGGHIVTQQFIDNYLHMTGAGVTIGLVIYFLVFAKSAQYKALGRLGGAPAVFNINEPIIFGTPVVMNPLLLLPFFLTPMLTGTLLYFLMGAGILPLFTAVLAPWTTPPVISGLIIGGWQHAIFQALIIVMSVAIYYVFARRVDLLAYADEQAARAAEANASAEVK